MKNVLIIEDSKLYIQAYKDYLKKFNLYIIDKFSKALEFIKSNDLNKIDIAIIDLNLGKGLKISGFNIIYNIYKVKPNLPVIICTGFKNDKVVKKYNKITNAKIIEKPFDENLADIVKSTLIEKIDNKIKDVDPLIKAFMSSAIYLVNKLKIDYPITNEYNDVIADIESLEETIINEYEKIKLSYGDVNINRFSKNIKEYIDNLLYISQSLILAQINVPIEEEELIEEISKLGNELSQKLSKF